MKHSHCIPPQHTHTHANQEETEGQGGGGGGGGREEERGGRAPVLDGYQNQIPASQGEKISDLCPYEHGLKCPEQNINFKLNESTLCILSHISSV